MKAILCRQYGPPESLEYADIPPEKPGEGQVLIDVYYAGVNFPDTLVILGRDQYKPTLPFSPGGEISGTIKAIGPGVKGFEIGDRVFAGTVWGGYREQVVARANNTFKMPDTMDYLTASVFLATYGTAIHCLIDKANCKAGETVAVLGAAGGVGTAVIQVAKALGARVIACASTQEKLDYCKANGADELLNYREVDLKKTLKTLTDGKGVDIMCDPVGSDYSEPALRATAWKGRFMVLGFTAGLIAKIPLNLPLLKGNAIIGVFWSTFARRHPDENRKNVTRLLEMYEAGKLKPHVHKTFSLKDAPLALFEISNRKVKGKIALSLK
ncbi:MAG: NADPH:quinone oxidoreductase family protein [Bacteroidota bacterium]